MGAEFATVKDEPWEYNFGVADSAKDTLAQGTYLTSTGTAVSDAFARRHLASRKLASTETAIEIQCGSSCATVEALLASDSFESTMEAKGETVVVAKDSMLTYDSASSAIGSVTTVVTGSPTVSPTDSPVTTTTTETVTVTESDDDYKTIAIVFIIVSVILLIPSSPLRPRAAARAMVQGPSSRIPTPPSHLRATRSKCSLPLRCAARRQSIGRASSASASRQRRSALRQVVIANRKPQ